MKEQQYLFIDFEFTMPEKGWKTKGFYPEIIEAGIVSVVNGTILHEYSSYVKPERFPVLSKRCKSFLNIEQPQIDSGISFRQLVENMRKINEKRPCTIVTWGNMDMKVLKNNCLQAGVSFPFVGREIDLSMEYKRFFGDQNQTGLWKAVQEYGRDGTGKHHRALDDAMTTYNIFKLVEKDKKYLQKPKPTTIGDLVDFSKLFNHYA
ncbi:sporulation inhibitor KapD [Cytobacillus horneckiae]|uniref:Or 3'-5' exonuclease KapD n=1 Tax=Cytobacillus horneckiae TaxID=549687 RepID=A0A2N0ZE68_9BACI|nr:3'-5' exonuclease KapD [Cytobacillus horneckiae]MBN6889040.1 3'-5' exonuclease KapD [Cytobacillus horneckiae]MEC1157522.1 3'-5' exonuclease KapD [Cytobacillus horneckiae]MED2939470.1 3'-5' exonuclease KapD [Cytobacillus horneckiae]PKG27804.1 or 3'-5' exonuclease KapD [Cytobacillus horneckiae]